MDRALTHPDHATTSGPPRRLYSYYVLFILFSVQVLNYVDRNIISILVEPIKQDLKLSDTQLGILTGFVFAGVLGVAGLPLGWLADRSNRKVILSVSLLVWSAMTAACASAAALPGFVLVRMGVGLGEAGGVATTYSLTADYTSARNRSFAFGVISFGTTAGLIVGLLVGAYGLEQFGWRGAFLLVGLPGVLLSLLVALTVREPVRGRSDGNPRAKNSESVGETLRAFVASKSLLHVVAGGSVSAVGNAALIWLPALFHREFALDVSDIGWRLAFSQGTGSLIGTVGGGWLCDRLSRRDPRWQSRFAGWTTLLSAPAFAASFLSTDPGWATAFLIPAFALKLACLGPYYTMIQSLAGASRRSSVASASMFFLILVGGGIGPLLIGGSSDVLSSINVLHALRWALCGILPFIVWGGLHYLCATPYIKGDLMKSSDA